jgi:hypothetical protein
MRQMLWSVKASYGFTNLDSLWDNFQIFVVSLQ